MNTETFFPTVKNQRYCKYHNVDQWWTPYWRWGCLGWAWVRRLLCWRSDMFLELECYNRRWLVGMWLRRRGVGVWKQRVYRAICLTPWRVVGSCLCLILLRLIQQRPIIQHYKVNNNKTASQREIHHTRYRHQQQTIRTHAMYGSKWRFKFPTLSFHSRLIECWTMWRGSRLRLLKSGVEMCRLMLVEDEMLRYDEMELEILWRV